MVRLLVIGGGGLLPGSVGKARAPPRTPGHRTPLPLAREARAGAPVLPPGRRWRRDRRGCGQAPPPIRSPVGAPPPHGTCNILLSGRMQNPHPKPGSKPAPLLHFIYPRSPDPSKNSSAFISSALHPPKMRRLLISADLIFVVSSPTNHKNQASIPKQRPDFFKED